MCINMPKTIKEERLRWVLPIYNKEIKLKDVAKGELVEIDVKYAPETIKNQQYYQFTVIDCASRWRYLKIYNDYSNFSSMAFLEELIRMTPFRIRAVKIDNGSNFTNRYTGYLKSSDPMNPRLRDFDLICQKYNIIHYLIDPGQASPKWQS